MRELDLVLLQQRHQTARAFVGLVIIAAALSAAFALASLRGPDAAPGASKDQQRIVERLGAPATFTIAYLPIGQRRSAQLTRTEIWYYPEHGQSISFVAGEVVSIDPAQDLVTLSRAPRLLPWQVDDATPRSQLDSATVSHLVPAEFAPVTSEAAQVYMGEDALYVIERGRLVYFTTAGRVME